MICTWGGRVWAIALSAVVVRIPGPNLFDLRDRHALRDLPGADDGDPAGY